MADAANLLARDTFISNMSSDCRLLRSFEIFHGYTASILVLPPTVVTLELL